MSKEWVPFTEQEEKIFKLDAATIARLDDELEKINKGRKKAKLKHSDMISHWLLEMGRTVPKIESKKSEPADLKVTLFGLASDYLNQAAEKNKIPPEEVIKHLLSEKEQARRKPKAAKKS